MALYGLTYEEYIFNTPTSYGSYNTSQYYVTNKAIDHVFGKYKSTDSSQNKDSLNTPISQNVESKSQKTKGELDQNDIKENAAIKIQSFVRSVQLQRKQDISVRKIQAFVKPKISKTSKD